MTQYQKNLFGKIAMKYVLPVIGIFQYESFEK